MIKWPHESLIKPGAAISNYGSLDRRRRGQSEVALCPRLRSPRSVFHALSRAALSHVEFFVDHAVAPESKPVPIDPQAESCTAESAQEVYKGAAPWRGKIDDRTNGRGVIFIPPEDSDSRRQRCAGNALACLTRRRYTLDTDRIKLTRGNINVDVSALAVITHELPRPRRGARKSVIRRLPAISSSSLLMVPYKR